METNAEIPGTPDNNELVRHIIKHAAAGGKANDLILEICQQTGMSWPQAEALVEQVTEEHKPAIAKRQAPIMFILAGGIFLGGIVMTGYGIYTTSTVIGVLTADTVAPWDLPGTLSYIINFAGYAIFTAAFGLSMILGSLIGMKQVWMEILGI